MQLVSMGSPANRMLAGIFVAVLCYLTDASSPVAVGDDLTLFFCNTSSGRQAWDYGNGTGSPFSISVRDQTPGLVWGMLMKCISIYHAYVARTAQTQEAQHHRYSRCLRFADIIGPSNDTGTGIHTWGLYQPLHPNQQWYFRNGVIQSFWNKCLGVTSKPSVGSPLVLVECSQALVFAFNNDTGTFSTHASDGGSLCVAAGESVSCVSPPFSGYTYCNTSAPLAARIDDLVARMTPEEKAAALDSSVPPVSRLGVPGVPSGEALHGVATGCLPPNATAGTTGCPTSFPCPAALGASFDPTLWSAIGSAIGLEARAIHNARGGSLWLFAPNLNPARAPQCE